MRCESCVRWKDLTKQRLQTCGHCHHYKGTPQHIEQRRHKCPTDPCLIRSTCPTNYLVGHKELDAQISKKALSDCKESIIMQSRAIEQSSVPAKDQSLTASKQSIPIKETIQIPTGQYSQVLDDQSQHMDILNQTVIKMRKISQNRVSAVKDDIPVIKEEKTDTKKRKIIDLTNLSTSDSYYNTVRDSLNEVRINIEKLKDDEKLLMRLLNAFGESNSKSIDNNNNRENIPPESYLERNGLKKDNDLVLGSIGSVPSSVVQSQINNPIASHSLSAIPVHPPILSPIPIHPSILLPIARNQSLPPISSQVFDNFFSVKSHYPQNNLKMLLN